MPNLTNRTVNAATFDPAGPSFQWIADDEIRGFGLRLQKTRKSFALRYTARRTGTQRYLQLATYPEVTVTQARNMAKKAVGRIADGADPVAEQRQEREEARRKREAAEKAVTFGEFADTYLRRMESRWTKRTLGDYTARIKRNLRPTLLWASACRASSALASWNRTPSSSSSAR